MFIQPAWPAPAHIRAYSTLRKGGYSAAPYDEFNLALHVEDQEDHVHANRQQLQTMLQLPQEPLWLQQSHGATVVEALPENFNKKADGSFTRKLQQVCAILTADCLPVLLCDQQGSIVAAIHAGWRGLAAGILQEALHSLKTPAHAILAWLGPAIGPQKFEVGTEVYTLFIAQDPANQQAFIRTTATTWLADIYTLARLQLHSWGLSAIYGGEYCTFTQKEQFFSYRRDQKRTGRMATLIWMAPQE